MMHSVYSREVGTARLVQDTADDARELVRVELALAWRELREDVGRAKRAVIFGACAIVTAVLGVAFLLFALGLVLGAGICLGVGLICVGVGGGLGLAAYARAPLHPMSHTLHNLDADRHLLKGHA